MHKRPILHPVYSPFGIGEHELPQLQIAQHDALLVAALHHLAHLPEQAPCLGLAQALALPHVRMEVALLVLGENREDYVK